MTSTESPTHTHEPLTPVAPSSRALAPSPFRPSIRAHVAVTVTLEVAGFFAAFAAAVAFAHAFDNVLPGATLSVVAAALTLGAPFAAIRAIRAVAKRVPAACPECGAASFVRPRNDSRSFSFVCVACGHSHDTGVRY